MRWNTTINPLQGKIAILPAVGLGDALIYMTLSNNLQRNGYAVTTFSNALYQLKDWFPNFAVQPYPDSHEAFADFGTVIDGHEKFLPDTPELNAKRYVIKRKSYDRKLNQVENLALYCERHFACSEITKENGIKPPANLQFRVHRQRVVLHCTSSNPARLWPAQKYLRLARKLKQMRFDPIFTVGPAERAQWTYIMEEGFALPLLQNFNELAQFIYESGYFIGNDSGPGHLASNLGIPTLTLFYKKSHLRRWRPAWAPGAIAIPPVPFLPSKLKRKYWKQLLTVGQVLRLFKRLSRSCYRNDPASFR